jgi:phage gp36-like protein
MTQTYCIKSDIEALWPPADLLASVDDDASGTLTATEEGYITRAIERAANQMNVRLETRYTLEDLAQNTWCRDANAAIAAFLLATRRGDPAPAQLQEQYEAYLAALAAIAAGTLKVPQQAESFTALPSVTNFAVRLDGPYAEAEVVEATSVDVS